MKSISVAIVVSKENYYSVTDKLEDHLTFYMTFNQYIYHRVISPRGFGDKDVWNGLYSIDPDIVLILDMGMNSCLAKAWCLKNKVPFVMFHTPLPSKFLYNDWFKWQFCKWFYSGAKKVFAFTEGMSEIIKQECGITNVSKFQLCTDLIKFNPIHNTRLANDKTKVLLNVSDLEPGRRVEDFCDMVIPNCKKIQIGNGSLKKKLETKYTDVEFKGYIHIDYLKQNLANADVLVFSQAPASCGGLIQLEAMASGTPVASTISHTNEYIIQGVSGYYNNSLRLATSGCLSLRRGKTRHEFCKRHRPEDIYEILQKTLL